jgi:hypothetical protein
VSGWFHTPGLFFWKVKLVMKRWDCTKNIKVECSDIDAFIEDIIVICKKHGMSIAHEDGHGAFQIEVSSETNFDWLRAADKNFTR